MPEPETFELEVPGASLAYDVRRSSTAGASVLLMVGSPMGAAGFGTLAGYFPDRTVVTYDPRGVERSRRTDGASESTPEEHADDLRRVIEAVGGAPVDAFASSGGAVNALVLVARHPELVRTLVAHEPPAADALPDRAEVFEAWEAIHATYEQDGFGPAMARFMALVSHRGPVPAGWAQTVTPDPAAFGLPTTDDGTRDDPLLGQNTVTSIGRAYDFTALKAASTHIVIGVGVESDGELAHRAGEAVAARLGSAPLSFPSHHGGFLGGEYGYAGEPGAFATTLRAALEDRPSGGTPAVRS